MTYLLCPFDHFNHVTGNFKIRPKLANSFYPCPSLPDASLSNLGENHLQIPGTQYWFFEDELHEKKYHEPLFQHERTGRPLGSDLRIDKLEVLLRKQLRNKKTGLKGPWEERGNQ